MRPEYDFSKGKRGKYARKLIPDAQGRTPIMTKLRDALNRSLFRLRNWYEDEQVIRKMKKMGYTPAVIKEHRRAYKLAREKLTS